jgi:putative tricarboxylic transport membrane protein
VPRYARSGDFWSGLALAALGAWIVGQARGWTYMGEDGPGAGFFPLWYGAVMVLLSLVLVARTVMAKVPREGNAPEVKAPEWRELGRALACWAALVASIALMPLTGFLVAFALLTWFVVAILARQPQRVAITLALGSSLAFYVLFAVLLDVSLPKGLLF